MDNTKYKEHIINNKYNKIIIYKSTVTIIKTKKYTKKM